MNNLRKDNDMELKVGDKISFDLQYALEEYEATIEQAVDRETGKAYNGTWQHGTVEEQYRLIELFKKN